MRQRCVHAKSVRSPKYLVWDALVLLVTPLLRKFDNPRFETFGEAVAFFTQIFSVRRSSSNIISLTIDGTLGLAIITRT